MGKTIVRLFGVVFILIGILGFFNDPLLGLFDVNPMHNIVHLLSGIAALAMSNTEANARLYGKIFGIVYALVAILGFIVGSGSLLGVAINPADNWLHVILTLVFLYVGFMPMSRPATVSQAS